MKKLLLFTILILTGFPFSFADTIYLNEGMTIEGKIVEINPRQNIVICTPDGRTFTYPIDDILRIKLSDDNTPGKEVIHRIPHPDKKRHLNNERIRKDAKPTPPAPEKKHVAKRGYHGYFSTSYAIFLPDCSQIGFATTHGAQLYPQFFIGGGLALNFIADGEKGKFYMPIYAEARTNWGEKLAQFSAGTRIGVTIGSDIGFYWHLDAGLRLGFTPKFAMHIAPFVEFQRLWHTAGYIYDSYSGHYTYSNEWGLTCAPGLRVGFEF